MKRNGYRERCLREKEDRCSCCDSLEDIVVHHVDGDRSNNEMDNLLPVCRSCHNKIHHGSEGYVEWYEKLKPRSQLDMVGQPGGYGVKIEFEDGDQYERLKELKKCHGLTWKGLILQGEMRVREQAID